MLAMVQLLPRNATEATAFDPVFKPPAPDPPRNLPRFLRAGTVIPPEPASSSQKSLHPTAIEPGESPILEKVDSSRGPSDSLDWGFNNTTLVGLISADVVLLIVAAVCVALMACSWSHHASENPRKKWKKRVITKLNSKRSSSPSRTRDIEMVCFCCKSVYAVVLLLELGK
jgi:hypothetical protein